MGVLCCYGLDSRMFVDSVAGTHSGVIWMVSMNAFLCFPSCVSVFR